MHSQKRANVQTTIVALLVARKGGCTLSQLSKDYYETEGETIPWKELGYPSLLNFLQSMPGSVDIDARSSPIFLRGIASNKSKHISKLVAGQKDAQKLYAPRRSFRQSHYYPNTGPQRVHIPAEILSTVVSYINDHPDGVNKDYLLQYIQSYMPHTNISMSDMEEQLNKLSHQIYQSHNKFFPVQRKIRKYNLDTVVVTASGEEDSDDLLDCEDDEDGFGFVSSEYKAHPLEAKSSAKTKPTSSFIQDSLSKCHDSSVENQILVHTSQYQTNSLPSNIYNYNESNQGHIEYNNLEQENYFDGNNVDILINERVKFRLEKLIQGHPDGIWCADLPEKYLQEYKITLNYSELGFNSVREFASQLPDIFHCVQPNDTGDFMLYYAKAEIPLNKQKEKQKSVNLAELHNIYDKDEEPDALPTTLSLDTCKKLIPDGIVTIGECVGQINVEDLVDIEKPYIEVIVVEVFTPSFFWIQLRKKQKAFKVFMDDLHEFYTRSYDKYTIPPVVLEKGLNCACVYNGIWHRGIIKTVKPDFQVTVMFYDYGTLKTYPPNAVYYLHRLFSSLPAQAIPCGLINTKPYKGSKWSRSATHEFAVKTSLCPLIATVASINIEDNSMMVTLTDTSEEEDLHINDWLVEQKLAQHGKMVCKKHRNFPFRYYVECQKRFKQMTDMSENSKVVQPLKYYEPILYENSGTKVALYNNSKVDQNKKTESPKGLKTLYEKLISFKQSSHSNNSSDKMRNNSTVNCESASTNLVTNKIDRINLHESSDHNIKNNKKCNILSSTFKRSADPKAADKKINENKEYNIQEKFGNIPNAYAHHFRIQDPEEELDITCAKPYIDPCYKQDEFEEADWSVIQNDTKKRKEYAPQQDVTETIYKSASTKRENIPLAESCFLNAVRSSAHFVSRDENIRWSPKANVNQSQCTSPLILKNFKKRVNNNAAEKVIAISKPVLEVLTGRELLSDSRVSLTNIPKDTNEARSICSSQGVSSVTADDSSYSNNNSTFNIETSQSSVSDSKTPFKNDCLSMKLNRYERLRRLLANRQVSSNTSHIDSDDLSVSETSKVSERNINNTDDKCQMEENKNDISVNESTSIRSNLEINDDSLHSTTESTSLNMIDSGTNSKHESYQPLISSETSSEIEEDAPVESPLPEEEAVIEEVLTPENSMIQPAITENERITAEPALTRELVPHDTVNDQFSIPVFNDIDLESDEEEWDTQMSMAHVYDFLKINCPFNKTMEALTNQLRQESNACVEIEEIDDSQAIEYRNASDEKQENNNKEVMYSTGSTEISNSTEDLSVESENSCDRFEEIEESVSDSQNDGKVNIKDDFSSAETGFKLQGKAKTLAAMLNKVKVLQNNNSS